MTSYRSASAAGISAVIRIVVLTVALLAGAGCAERYMQKAQDSFSRGAAIENQVALGVPASSGLANPNSPVTFSAPQPAPLAGSAQIYYLDAYDNVRKALSAEAGALKEQGLTGPAYALLAMVSWRLDDLQGTAEGGSTGCEGRDYRGCAIDSSKKAIIEIGDKPFYARDRYTLAILPGLLDHNLGLRNMKANPEAASANFRSAFGHMAEGIDAIGTVSPVAGMPLTTEQSAAIFGLLSQYQTLRAWSVTTTWASIGATVPEDQRLNDQERASCKYKLRQDWADTVAKKLQVVDPAGLVVPPALRHTFAQAIGDTTAGAKPCPWQL